RYLPSAFFCMLGVPEPKDPVMKTLIMTLMFALLLAGCGKATIDASSQEALEASVEEIAEELDAQQKQAFQQAVITIAMDHSTRAISSAMSGKQVDQAQMERDMLDALDGKTASEVSAYAEELKKR